MNRISPGNLRDGTRDAKVFRARGNEFSRDFNDFPGGILSTFLHNDLNRATIVKTLMKPGLLLYVAVGIEFGSMILGLAVALAYVLRKRIQEFRYGMFYSVFALVASIGYCLASIGFFFNFLTRKGSIGIPLFCSLVALGLIAGLIVLGLFVKKDDRILFVVLSFYCLITIWLAPLFVWNLIYLIFIVRRSRVAPPST